MKKMLNYRIISSPNQYEDVMKFLYELEIFPMEEDPVDLQDYIDNFNFSEEADGYLSFLLWCSADSEMSGFEDKLKNIPNYDVDNNLPRLLLDGDAQ